MKKTLTAQEVINYMENHNTVHLSEPSNNWHEVLSVEHTDEGYVFHNGYRNTFMLGNEDITEVFEENGIVHFLNTNGDSWKLTALINEDVSEGMNFAPSDEELPEDGDIFRLMWKRAEAIESYINKRLFIDKDAKIKVICRLHAEMGLHDYLPEEDGSYDKNPIILYDYEYRLSVVNGNPRKSAAWIRDIPINLQSSNEEALAWLTRYLIMDRLPADKQIGCFDWDEEYGKYDDEETDGDIE